MSPVQAITSCLRKSFQFSGRASRAEFWLFALAVFLVFHFVGMLDFALRLRADAIYASLPVHQIAWLNLIDSSLSILRPLLTFPIGYSPTDHGFSTPWMGDLTFLALPYSSIMAVPFLLLIIPILSAMARRSHDAGFSGILTLLAYFWPTILIAASNTVYLIVAPAYGSALAQFTQNIFGPALEYSWPLSKASALYAIYVLISPSQPGPNRYGPNPLEVTP